MIDLDPTGSGTHDNYASGLAGLPCRVVSQSTYAAHSTRKRPSFLTVTLHNPVPTPIVLVLCEIWAVRRLTDMRQSS